MDFSPLFRPLFTALWWLFPLFLLATLAATPWGKGWIGEWLVRAAGWLFLDRDTYHWRNDVTLPCADGSTQIDHIIVSPYGIFVLETKNMRGWIFGQEDQAQWTQRLFKQSFRFQNPLRQNYKHLMTLEETLGLPPEFFHSVVVFVGDCNFKTEMPTRVTRGLAFISYIKSFRTPLMASSDVRAALQTIDAVRYAPSMATRRSHVRHLREKAERAAQHGCPCCGRTMVLRTVKSGVRTGETFWGCPAYPRCRGTRSATAE